MSYTLTLKDKTGFDILDPMRPVIIRDDRGILFYSTEDMIPRVQSFNLPAGKYMVDQGKIRQRKMPVSYTLSQLPLPERIYPSPTNFNVVFGNNPNKCSVLWDEKTILFDNAFLEKPLPYIYFILYHEEGHSRYKTEKYADLYASNKMLEKGFNESQIGIAHLMTLSSNQFERKAYINHRILRRNGKR